MGDFQRWITDAEHTYETTVKSAINEVFLSAEADHFWVVTQVELVDERAIETAKLRVLNGMLDVIIVPLQELKQPLRTGIVVPPRQPLSFLLFAANPDDAIVVRFHTRRAEESEWCEPLPPIIEG